MQDIPEMTAHIKSFSLNGDKGFSRVLLQLFGFLGHGKSSFINTCKYVLDDTEYQIYADVKNNDGGNTTARITYPLTDTLTLVDNRGCSVMNDYEAGEVYAQLGNLLPLDQEVEWSKDLKLVDRIVAAERYVQSSDFIFPIFVYSVKKGLSSAEVPEIKDLLTTARTLTGIFPMVILTHKTHSNLRDVKDKFEDMGVERIFALENFTPEDHLKTRGKHEDVLKIFLEVIKDIKFTVERLSDPEGEKEKRKTFVFRFIYEMELKKKEKEMEKKRLEEEMEKKRLEEERERARWSPAYGVANNIGPIRKSDPCILQ